MEIDADAEQFLREHLWGLLATGRSSGAPQVSMVAYEWNGTDLAISCRGATAKYRNADKRPDVVFTVADDVDCLTITGRAHCHRTGPARDEATERVRVRLRDGAEWGAAMLDRDIEQGLDAVDRVAIVIEPTKVQLVKPLG